MSSFLPDIDSVIQQGRGIAADVLGQTYAVRRLDSSTNVSISSNAPIVSSFLMRIRKAKKTAVEDDTFNLLLFEALCDNGPLISAIASGESYSSLVLQETGYQALANNTFTLAQIRPTRETLIVRTEFAASITRPMPPAGRAAQMPTQPGQIVAPSGYGANPKTEEEFLTLTNGMYSFQSSGQMATVYVGIQQTRKIGKSNPLKTPTALAEDEFLIYVPKLPGVILERMDRINVANRYEIVSVYTSEESGVDGYICFAHMLGV